MCRLLSDLKRNPKSRIILQIKSSNFNNMMLLTKNFIAKNITSQSRFSINITSQPSSQSRNLELPYNIILNFIFMQSHDIILTCSSYIPHMWKSVEIVTLHLLKNKIKFNSTFPSFSQYLLNRIITDIYVLTFNIYDSSKYRVLYDPRSQATRDRMHGIITLWSFV